VLGCHGQIARWKDGLAATFALAGNPNVGKSSVFNWLTGMGVVTANYPGKTVEVNLATTRFKDLEIGIMDLPGTYAMGSASEDQWVARRALLDGAPGAVLVVVDATRLERNLYLPLELLDLGFPVVIALNLVDEAWREGLRIDHIRLSRLLGVPVVPTVAVRGQGLDRLVEVGLKEAQSGAVGISTPRYGRDVEEAIALVGDRLVKENVRVPWNLPARAVAVLLLEGDEETLDQAWGTLQQVADAHTATALQTQISAATPAITVSGTPAVGELVLFRVGRLPADGSDTLGVDAMLIGVMIGYTRS